MGFEGGEGEKGRRKQRILRAIVRKDKGIHTEISTVNLIESNSRQRGACCVGRYVGSGCGCVPERGVSRKIRQGRAREEEKLSRTVEEDEVNLNRERREEDSRDEREKKSRRGEKERGREMAGG